MLPLGKGGRTLGGDEFRRYLELPPLSDDFRCGLPPVPDSSSDSEGADDEDAAYPSSSGVCRNVRPRLHGPAPSPKPRPRPTMFRAMWYDWELVDPED